MTAYNIDNRDFPGGEDVADRVLMGGYVVRTHEFIPKALSIAKDGGAIIHYHNTVPREAHA